MEKARYREIRKLFNFLYVYYLEYGGIMRNEEAFYNALAQWLLSVQGVNLNTGEIVITRYLDKKHQYFG